MQTAKYTALKSDREYVKLLDAQSRWPFGYVMSMPQPVNAFRRAIEGQTTVYVGARQVRGFNHLLPRFTRMQVRASQNKPETELFGTAPYVALGRGHLRNIDASNTLYYGAKPTNLNLPRRTIVETPLDRTDFIDYEPTAADFRLGAMTRVGPQYLKPGTR